MITLRETTDITEFMKNNETEHTKQFERDLDLLFNLADKYERLKEVAVDMFKMHELNDVFKLASQSSIDDWREELEELGVDIDG